MLAQGWMYGSKVNHTSQCAIFISLNNQYAVIQWPVLDVPTNTHGVFTSTLSLPKYCLLRLCRKQYGLMLAQRYFKGQRSSINHKIKLFCKLVQLLKYTWYMCKLKLSQSNFHQDMEIHYLSMHWTWSWNSHFNQKALIGVWHLPKLK